MSNKFVYTCIIYSTIPTGHDIVGKHGWARYYKHYCYTRYLITLCPTVILDGPKDITVFPNHEAVFHCFTRDVSSINWMINDTDLDDLPSTLRDDLILDSSRNQGFQLFSLNITGRVEYNGTRIRCVIAGDNESTSATFYIQGVTYIIILYKCT